MSARRQRGVALAIVLWFLAGMCLLVSGITYLARMDTKMAQLHLARAKVASAGDGAILLTLARFSSRDTSQRVARTQVEEFKVGEQLVSVVMVPTDGLINLNAAPVSVLARLFSERGDLPQGEAQALATSVVQWRKNSGPYRSENIGGKFQSSEDVLQVEGMTRSVWDAVRDSVVVSGGSSRGETIAVAADPLQAGLKDTEDGAEARSGSVSRSYRMDAIVKAGGRTWLRRKWVNLGGGSSSRLPWRFSRVEAPRVLAEQAPG